MFPYEKIEHYRSGQKGNMNNCSFFVFFSTNIKFAPRLCPSFLILSQCDLSLTPPAQMYESDAEVQNTHDGSGGITHPTASRRGGRRRRGSEQTRLSVA